MAIDLHKIFTSAAEQQIQGSQEMKNQLTEISGQKQNVFDDLVSNLVSSGDAAQIITGVEEAGKLETQNRKAEFFHTLHMDGELNARLSTQMADAFYKNSQEAQALADDVKQRESVGLFDNPIAYLWNQVMLPDARNARDAAIERADISAKTMQAANTMLQQTAATEQAYTISTSAAAVDAKLQAIKAETYMKVDQARIQALSSQAQDVKAIFDADREKLQIMQQVMQARNSEEHMQIARAAEGRAQAQFNEWKQGKKDKENADAQLLEYIRVGVEQTGGDAGKRIDLKNVASFLKSGQPLPENLNKLAEIGFKTQVFGLTGLSTNVLDATKTATMFGIQPPVATAQALNTVGATVDNLIKTSKPELAKNKEALATTYNQTAQDVMKEYASLVKPDDPSNPYSAPSIKVMAQQSKEFAASPLYQKVLLPQIEAGKLDTNDPNTLVKLGLAAKREGKISLNELALGLQTYYSQGVMAASLNNQLKKFGLPETTQYQAVVETSYSDPKTKGMFFGANRKKINWTDITLVQEHLVKEEVAQAMQQRAEVPTPISLFGVK